MRIASNIFCCVLMMLIASTRLAIAAEPPTVTLHGLLEEMIDLEAVARWPAPAFTVKQSSSYDRARTGPDKPGWFANHDSSNYVRTETHNGRTESVMLDVDGPGAIVRFFLTSPDPRTAKLRLYLDGADEAALFWPTYDLLDSDLKIAAPLCSRHPAPLGHGGSTMYLPIPYAHHCKVTVEETNAAHPGARYYHIDYRTYPAGTAIESFAPAVLEAERPTIDRVNQQLAKSLLPPAPGGAGADIVLNAQSEKSIDLPDGPAAVRELFVSLGGGLSPVEREQALRSVVLRVTFDDEPESIWCPVGDFFGSGAGGRAVFSWYRTVDQDGNAVCRWTMPYQKRGRITLQNLGNQPVTMKLTAHTSDWKWDDRSMYFHCNWHQQVQIPARPYRDWNFVTITGRGLLVGDVMSVFNRAPAWYGEGNEKIWVDGESFPSHLGTGTEDYYNASWAPNPVYQTPFANHPRIDDPQSDGQNVYTRTRNLDAIPFEKSLQFDFEIWTWKDERVDYSATTYWYGLPGAKANVAPEPIEARRAVQALSPPMVIQGAVECETLPIPGKSADLVVEPQDMSWAAGTWSAHSHLLVRGTKVGDFVELAIPAEGTTARRVTLFATRAYDYGILKFSVNGLAVDETLDGYAVHPTPTGPIALGIFAPKDGKYILRAELVGTNAASGGNRYLAGLDAVVLSDH